MRLIKKEDKKPMVVIKVRIKGEIYDRVYGVRDIEYVVNLFNEMHGAQMKISIEGIEEEKDNG